MIGVLIITMIFSSCVSLNPPGGSGNSQAMSGTTCMAMYTLGAAAGGAIVGGVVEGKKGAIVGGLAGAALGAAIAWKKCFSQYSRIETETVMGSSETAKAMNYDPSQGTILKFLHAKANPYYVAPGGKLDFDVKYVTLSPPENTEIKVTETRCLRILNSETNEYDSCEPEKDIVTVENCEIRNSKTNNPDQGIEVPKEMGEAVKEKKEGIKCKMEYSIQTENITDTCFIEFVVTNNPELLAKNEKYEWGNTIADASSKSVSTSMEKSINEKRTITITDKTATLRKHPSKNAEKLGSVRKGNTLPFVKEDTIDGKKWYEVKMEGGETAWIIANTSKLSNEPTSNTQIMDGKKKIVTIISDTAILRKHPDKQSEALGTVKKSKAFIFVQEAIVGTKWYQVKLENGEMAWVFANNAKLSEE